MMPSFAARSAEPERMDSETASARCLDDLAFVNRLTMVHRPTIAWVRRALRGAAVGTRPKQDVDGRVKPGHDGGNPDVSLLDVACGYGDGLRLLRRKFPRLRLSGIDLNISPARAATRADEQIKFFDGDVFTLDREFDLVVATQFTHHLDRETLVRYLRWAEAHSRVGWFICDLHRHVVPWLFIRALPRLVRLDPMVAHDGPISVARAFVRRDWEEALAEAGIRSAEIRWFVFRWGVGRLK